jgi:outer membrane protein OmpA-like peptidoglycan-associated protein
MKTNPWWMLVPLALLGTQAALGEQVRMYGAQEVPKAAEIADILRGESAAPPRMKMRGISLDSAYLPKGETKSGEALAQISKPPEDAFALQIQFDFNSAEIQPGAGPQLDAVAEGIKLVPDARVVVEGHTDAHGAEPYNESLSLARAQAVKQYLVERHGISPTNLVVEGFGEQAPLANHDPYAPQNRRVQFRAAR